MDFRKQGSLGRFSEEGCLNRDPCWEAAATRSGEEQGEGPELKLPFSFSGQSTKTSVAVVQGLRDSVKEVGVKRQAGTRQS